MKLTLVLLLCAASVALLKAEEESALDDTSAAFLYDGSLEDEVLGHEEDPGMMEKKKAALKRMGARRVCGRVLVGCLVKLKAPCKVSLKVCKAKYFACRCIVKGVYHCRRFLAWVDRVKKMHKKKMAKKEDEEMDVPEEGAPAKKPAVKKLGSRAALRECIAAAKGKGCNNTKDCRPCARGFVLCMKRKLQNGQSPKKADEYYDAMADRAEDEEDEQDEDEEEDEEAEKPGEGKIKALRRCRVIAVRCFLRARLDCRRQAVCVRAVKRCVRRAEKACKN
ncbi:uncharacterized protein LOC116617664 [Nematostella vectensis]|uniref:uncharacterized protein LOC116617664 n=1 Tax=Nematostella vectensis TaxID=45351 RepID=UPI0020777F1B|nr:uncharacterized protein LOC116617664 [Nematostella vectensis]